jgi:hypothetical protein
LIRRTIGASRLSSRRFFEPRIFFKIQPTISHLISARFGHYQLLAPIARGALSVYSLRVRR